MLVADVGAVADGAATAYFDGGVAVRLGAGGYAMFGGDGVCALGHGLWYGVSVHTNNKAEANTLHDLMKVVVRQPPDGVKV